MAMAYLLLWACPRNAVIITIRDPDRQDRGALPVPAPIGQWRPDLRAFAPAGHAGHPEYTTPEGVAACTRRGAERRHGPLPRLRLADLDGFGQPTSNLAISRRNSLQSAAPVRGPPSAPSGDRK